MTLTGDFSGGPISSPRDAVEEFRVAYVGFFETSIQFILAASERVSFFSYYPRFEEDLSAAHFFLLNKSAVSTMTNRLRRNLKKGRKTEQEVFWLAHEMTAATYMMKEADMDDPEAVNESAEQSDIVKGSVEEFLTSLAQSFVEWVSNLPVIGRAVGRTRPDEMERISSSTKLLNELFKLVARGS